MNPSDNKRLLAALNENWQAEMEGFSTYSALAKNENDPHRRNALRGLARAEKHHANLWAGRIKALGGIEPQYNWATRQVNPGRWRTESADLTWHSALSSPSGHGGRVASR